MQVAGWIGCVSLCSKCALIIVLFVLAVAGTAHLQDGLLHGTGMGQNKAAHVHPSNSTHYSGWRKVPSRNKPPSMHTWAKPHNSTKFKLRLLASLWLLPASQSPYMVLHSNLWMAICNRNSVKTCRSGFLLYKLPAWLTSTAGCHGWYLCKA